MKQRKNLQLPRIPIINTITKKHITGPPRRSKSPHRQHEEESTNRRCCRSRQRIGDCCHQPSNPGTVYTLLTYHTRIVIGHVGQTYSGKNDLQTSQEPECQTNSYLHSKDRLLTQKLHHHQMTIYYERKELPARCHSPEPDSRRQRQQERRGCSLVTRHALPRNLQSSGDNTDNTEKRSSPRAPTTENQP